MRFVFCQYLSCIFFLLFSEDGAARQIQNSDKKTLRIEWELIQNSSQQNPGFKAALILTNLSGENIPATGWSIYFNLRYHGYNLHSLDSLFEIKHVNGELFSISPTKHFSGLMTGQHISIKYSGNGRIANYQDVPSGLFWVNESRKDIAIALRNPIIKQPNGKNDTNERLLETDAAAVFKNNLLIENIPENKLPKIFPTPVYYNEQKGNFELSSGTKIIYANDFKNANDYLESELKEWLNSNSLHNQNEKKNFINLIRKERMPNEAYELVVHADSINIIASDAAGIFYGIQSLKSLMAADVWKTKHSIISIPCVEVRDSPRFPYRAFMLDVARNFQPKESILKLLDVMSLYKLNVFHFHLTDDEGWRLEIPGLPELTELGAKRGYPFESNQRLQPSYGSGIKEDSPGTGFYSKEDFIEILKYAHQRHILVVPEIETPGHAHAAIKSMDVRYDKYIQHGNKKAAEEYLLHDHNDSSRYLSNQGFTDNVMDPSLPSVYKFFEKVVGELQKMYAEALVPLTAIHVAGDEVPNGSWEKSPAAQILREKNPGIKTITDLWTYYFSKIKLILREKNIAMYGWQELATGTQTSTELQTVSYNSDLIKDSVQLDAWWTTSGNEDIPYKLANTGYKVVLSNVDYFYFDLAYTKDFDEPGDAWVGYLDIEKIFSFIPLDYYKNATEDIKGNLLSPSYFANKEKLTEAGEKNIRGIQGALWGENLVSPQLMEYLLIPKLLAVAERVWVKNPVWATESDKIKSQKLYQHDWSVFTNQLGKRELPRLNYYHSGFNYRIPAAGISISNHTVIANMQLPGFTIRYTTDGSEPNINSKIYMKRITEKGLIKFKVFDGRGRSGGSVGIWNKE